MKTVKQLQLSGLLVLLTLLSACQSKPKDGQTDTYTSGVIAIAADESFQPIVQEKLTCSKDCPLGRNCAPLCDGSRCRQPLAQGQSAVGNNQSQTDSRRDEFLQ